MIFENLSHKLSFYPGLKDILVAGKPQFQQNKSTLSATLNPDSQAIPQRPTLCQVAMLFAWGRLEIKLWIYNGVV